MMIIPDRSVEPSANTPTSNGSTLTIREAFNGTIVSSAICAAMQLGLLDDLAGGNPVDIATFAARRGLRVESVQAVATALVYADIARFTNSATAMELQRGDAFADAWSNKGYFLWLLGGYGQMLSRAAALCDARVAETAVTARDGSMIAAAGRDYGRHFVDPWFRNLLDRSDFTRAADLGCGSAQRLVELAAARPGTTYLGVERDPGAVGLARKAIRQAGVEDRIDIVQDDITTLEAGRFPSYDLVFSFFLGHDLWPRDRCLRVLDRLRRAFPGAKRLLLADTYRSGHLTYPDVPIFTLGFEYTHALMTQYVPSKAEWLELFDESRWRLIDSVDLTIPHSTVFVLTPR